MNENRVKDADVEEELKEKEKENTRFVLDFRKRMGEVKNSEIYRSYYRGLL